MSKKQSNASKQANLTAASERAAAIRAEHERKERRTRAFVIGSVVVAMLLIVVVLTYVMSRGDSGEGQTSSPPANVVDEYALAIGEADAPVEVTVYEDMMCPYCGLFEEISADRLKEYAASGDVQVRYHVVSFLDRASEDRYSTRAANAIAVVLDTAGPEAAVEFHDALFANQPEEGGAGIPDDEMIAMAVEAGASEEDIRGPIEGLKFEPWVENATEEWSKRGFTGTPAVAVDGEKVDFTDAENLLANTEQAIAGALGE